MTELELRSKIVSIMDTWVGLKESNGSFKQIIDLYNSHKPLARNYKVQYTDHWCATTVSAAFIQAGLTDIGFTECSCAKMIELYKAAGRWQEDDSYSPAPGDIIMYDWDDKGTGDNVGHPDHVGIVAKVLGKTMTIIEGNKNEAVGKRTMTIGGRYIRGYCLPDYAGKAAGAAKVQTQTADVAAPVLKKGSKGEAVKAMQTLLNLRAGAKLECDGSFGPGTDKAFRAWQRSVGLTADGSCGKLSWAALIGG